MPPNPYNVKEGAHLQMRALFDGSSASQSVLLDSDESDDLELEPLDFSLEPVSSLREPGTAVEDFERLSVT
jgi:hypothetical protein